MHYEDHPYEMYSTCMPCGPLQASQNCNVIEMQNTRPYNHHIGPHAREDCLRISNERSDERIGPMEYATNDFSGLNMTRKDSFFNPRSSLKFISGFKEWVSCLVMGTNKRKCKRKLVMKDRRSVTSVFLSNNSQSLTGQRLSSFSEYASVNMSRASSKNEKLNSRSSKESSNMSDNVKQTGQSKGLSRKKRPAPLPPVPYNKMPAANENRTLALMNGEAESINKKRDSQIENKNKIVAKTTKSTSIVSHSTCLKKSYKKRKAPSPPIVLTRMSSAIYATVQKKEPKSVQNGFACSSKHTDHNFPSVRQKHTQYITHGHEHDSFGSRKSKRHTSHQRKSNPLYRLDGSLASDESSSGSISFSPEESGDDKYGLVKYKMMKAIDSANGDLTLPGSSNFVQYAGENNDVCLKISIQKTETNVVTVEEVPTVHYTIEEDTSSSELSDNPYVPQVTQIERKAINEPPRPKAHSTDSSSVSPEETAEEPKTIFKELQIQPPAKGSVKDFVNAFNMLAIKSNGIGQFAPNSTAGTSSNGIKAKPKSIQSFPTNWEFQNSNNKSANVAYSSNQFLHPIAEESVNDISEHDGIEDNHSNKPKSKKKEPSHLEKQKCIQLNENTKEKCSHCSEKHLSTSLPKEKASKSLRKRIAPRLENAIHSEKLKPPKGDLASQAALLSLLHDKDESEFKGASKSSKNAKLDQPIMVGLYIEDKSSHRGPIPLLVTPSMSLKKLKKQVEAEYNFPRHQQCWILRESFAVQEDASLASYGVTEAGSPILLYVMAKESKSHSLPSRASTRVRSQQAKVSSSSSEEEVPSPRQHKRSHRKPKLNAHKEFAEKENLTYVQKDFKIADELNQASGSKVIPKGTQKEQKNSSKKDKSEYHKMWEKEFEKKNDYRTLVALDDVDLVANMEAFECPVCFLDVESGDGAVLQDCLHGFCRECLASSIQYSDTAVIKCPFRNDEYSCESHLQEREIKCLVTPEVYERHLQRSMALAESQAQDSFHCKTPDCHGWCLYEDNVNIFRCPVCKRTNCLTCAAIHEGKNCRQYQDGVAFNSDTSEEAKKTKEYLQNMVQNGEAMECPQCQVILMKKWGCDWLKCSMCHTEVCWVTKGPRWGPGGKGDTSGGCKCMLNGVRCHPKCSYCH